MTSGTEHVRLVVVSTVLLVAIATLGCQGLFDDPEELMDEDLGVEEQWCDQRDDCPDSQVCSEGACVDISCEGVDCPADQTCYRGTCVETCDRTADCGEDQRCQAGRCLHRDCREVACDVAEECYYGACRPTCEDDGDCAEADELEIDEPICDRGVCAAPLCEGTDLLPDGTPCPDGEVATLSVDEVEPTAATVHGALLELPEPAATDHGFCWSADDEPDHETGECASLGEPDQAGGFDHRAEGLQPGQTYRVRAYVGVERTDGEEIRFADDADPLEFTTGVPPVEDVEADQGESEQFVEVRWDHPDGWDDIEEAEGFRIIRDGDQVGSADATAEAWNDDDAEQGGVPRAPELTVTAGEHHDRVAVSWTEPEVPAGSAHSYQVVAVVETDTDEIVSAPSTPATGWRSGQPVQDYDLEIDDEIVVEGTDETDYDYTTDQGADVPTINPGTLDASKGASTQYVELSVEGADLEIHEHDYRVRATNEVGAGEWSTERGGWVGAGDLEFDWEYDDDGFEHLATTAGPGYLDASAPPDGADRTYRATVSAGGEVDAVQTGIDTGYRTALPIVATTGVTEVGIDSATFHAELIEEGRPEAGQIGVCVGTESDPDHDSAGDCGAFDDDQELTVESDDAGIDLEPGTEYWVRAWAESDEGIGWGENLRFVTELAAPELEILGEFVDRVELSWEEVDGAQDYEIYRDGEYVTTTDETEYDDEKADGKEPPAPAGVAATEGEYPDRVVVTWDEIEDLDEPDAHNYTVVATNEVTESSHSEIRVGSRRGWEVVGYQIRISGEDRSGEWYDAGTDPEYVDEEAEDASFAPEGVKTTAFPGYVLLELNPVDSAPGETSDYEVRGVFMISSNDSPGTGPASDVTDGYTDADEENLQVQWERAEIDQDDAFDEIPGDSSVYEDDEIERNQSRWYRAVLSVPDGAETTTDSELGVRTRRVYATDVFSGNDYPVFSLWDDGTDDWVRSPHEDTILDLAADPEGRLYTGSRDDRVCSLDAGGELQWCTDSLGASVYSLVVGGEDAVYAGLSDGDVVRIAKGGDQIVEYSDHDDEIRDLAFDADGYVYTASRDNSSCRLDENLDEEWCYDNHDENIESVTAGADDGVFFGTWSGDLCKLEEQDESASLVWCKDVHSVAPGTSGDNETINRLVTDPDGYLYTASSDFSACKWDDEADEQWCFEHDDSSVNGVAVDPEGYVYTASSDEDVCRLNEFGEMLWCERGDFDSFPYFKEAVAVYPGSYTAFPDAWGEENDE